MDPKEKKKTIQDLLRLSALVFPILVLGMILIGGSIFYLDCDRASNTVNCVITTRFLGTYITERRAASAVTKAVEAADCEEGSCRYRVELITAVGVEPLSVDYSNESKMDMVDRVNGYLADSNQPALRMNIVYRNSFIVSAVFILIGGAGSLWVLLRWINLLRVKTEWQAVIRSPKADRVTSTDRLFSQIDFGPPPQALRMEREITRLRFHYRHPAKKGFLLLLAGVVMVGLIWIYKEPIYFWIFAIGGLLMLYVGLATLINKWIIQVTYDELLVRYAPVPFYHRRRRIPSREIKQLYVRPRSIETRWLGDQTYYALEAVLQDNRRVSLISELSYTTLHYIELQIESWLKLEDRWVEGEVISDPLEDAIKG